MGLGLTPQPVDRHPAMIPAPGGCRCRRRPPRLHG